MNYTIQSRITPKIFQEFAWFDLLRQQKRWRAPLLFTLILSAFAGVCFLAGDQIRGAALLGGVLLGVGLILPLGWLLSFYLSVQAEAKKLRLAQAPVAYTLRLTSRELTASNDKERASFPWSQIHRACRLHSVICLYVSPRRAFLLPTGPQGEGDRLWRDICRQISGERTVDFRHRSI